jgi:hypothetical protein
MDDCLLDELTAAKEQGEDLTPFLTRMERCRWDHDVSNCEVCRSDGALPAQECVFRVYNLGVRS